MATVQSRDGTRIGYQQSGAGLPLVLVHGMGGAAVRWAPVLPALTEHRRVYSLDRRGRGASGDSDSYALEREVEDIVALVASIGEPVALFGHSYGAICALEAALHLPQLKQLLLYEPPLADTGTALYPTGLAERLEALLATGDRDGTVTTFLREVVRMPDETLGQLRSSAAWPARVAAAHTLPREVRAHAGYRLDAMRFRGLTTPTLLLLGEDSPPFFHASINRIAAALPTSRIVVLPGQQHVAMDTAPDLFTREVLAFLHPNIDRRLSAML